MLALRRARGPLGRAFGAVTQALDWSTPQADAPGSQAAGYRGTPQDRTGPHVDCFQSIPVRVVMGKASDGAAETSEEVPTEEEVTKAGTGVESQQSAHSAHSGSSANTPRDQEDAEMGEDDFQIVLLAAAMKHVAAEGWTNKALQLAAQDLKLSPMFAGVCSEAEFVKYFIETSNERLFERIRNSGPEFHSLPVPDKVALAVRWRLEMLSPYINTWPQAMALMAKPENARSAFFLMWNLSTKLSQLIDPQGVKAEPSLYSKAFALQAIYTSTELYMLTDFSPGHSETWQALDRRVADLSMIKSRAEQAERLLLEQVNKMATFGRP